MSSNFKKLPDFGFAVDLGLPDTAFNYSNCARNERLIANGFKPPKAYTTGTTVAAFIYRDGVILGSDKRSNTGRSIVSEDCTKIHFIAENIYCGAAGVAADTARIVSYASSNMEMQRLENDHQVPVISAVTDIKRALYERQGVLAIALVVAGVDDMGSHVFAIYPHGSTDRVPFASTGSGFLQALSIFDARWKDDLNEHDAIDVMREAISASIKTDLCSGANIDLCLIRKSGTVSIFRNVSPLNVEMGEREITYKFKRGTIGVLKTHFEFMEHKGAPAQKPPEENADGDRVQEDAPVKEETPENESRYERAPEEETPDKETPKKEAPDGNTPSEDTRAESTINDIYVEDDDEEEERANLH